MRYTSRNSTVVAAGICCASLICVLVAESVSAGNWRASPRLSVAETWSDNINLSDTNEETDFVTRITPGIAVVGDGSRVNFNLDYQLGLVHYARGSSGNRVDHRLQLTGDAELVDQRLFLDFASTAGQNNISSLGTLSSDNVNVNDNRQNFFTYSLSPFVVHHFGPFADGQARFRHAQVFNSDATDTTVNEVSVGLTSGRRFPTFPWTLSARLQRNENSGDTDSEFRNIDGSVRYAFSRRYTLVLNGGYENNQFETTRGDEDGVIWRVTGIWTPSARTTVELGYGGRFFGNFPTVDVTHRMRRALFTASYSEDTTTSASSELGTQVFPTTDAFGGEITDPGLAPTQIPIDSASLTDEVIVERRFDSSLALRARRTTSTVNVYYRRREFEVTPNTEDVYGVTARVSHSLSSNMSATVGGLWQHTDFNVNNREDDQWSLDLSLSRQFHSDISGTLSYAHRENDSSVSSNSYSENRVDARLTVLF